MTGPREWDAQTYDRVSGPQAAWGEEVIARLDLRGDERVLDAGCGSGRVTEQLLARLPDGELVGVDGSEAMIAEARSRLGRRVELVRSDLLDFEPDERFDAVFSNATFHWIENHDRLFARLRAWLRPGGRLEAQCGGEGNVAAFFETVDEVAARSRYYPHLRDLAVDRFFAGAEETDRRLAAVGFAKHRCWLESRPTRPPEIRAFIETVGLRAHCDGLPAELRGGFVDEIVAELGPDPVLDYVRLNISARR